MAGSTSVGILSLYSNDGQTMLYSGYVELYGATFVITQTGFTNGGIPTNIDYGTQILGWSATQGASVPDYAVGTQYTDEYVVPSSGSPLYIVPVAENKFVSSEGLNVLVNKIKSKQDAITSTNKLDYSLIANTPTIPSAVTSINGLSGGSLTSPLVITGGDAATAPKIALDQTASGQITNNGTQTLFGFTSNNASSLTIGHSSYGLALRGSGTRPSYNGNSVALSSDTAPSVAYTTTTPTAANTNGLKFVLCDSEPSTKYAGWVYLIKES